MSTIFASFSAVSSGGAVDWEVSGFDFTVASGNTLTVDNLLAFFPASGATLSSSAPKTITIWNTSTQAVAAQGTVATGTALYSGTQAQGVSITPVTLTAGTYRVSGHGFGSDGYASIGGSGPNPDLTFNLPSGVTYDTTYTQYYNTTAGNYPNNTFDTNDQYLIASFTYSGSGGGASLAWSTTSSTVVDSSTTASSTITLTGSSNAITTSVSGGGTISTTSPASGGSVTYTPPSTGSGTATVTASASGVSSVTWTIAYAPASSLTFNQPLSVTSNTPSGGITLAFSAASGGTGAIGYALWGSSSPFYTQTGGTQVASGSSSPLTDATPGTGMRYYRVVATDSVGATAASQQITTDSTLQPYYIVQPNKQVLNLSYIGDSTTIGEYASSSATTWPAVCTTLLREAFPTCTVYGAPANNFAVSGTTSADWLNTTGGANLATALASHVSGAANCLFFDIGINDAQSGNQFSAAAYRANVLGVCNAAIAGGWYVFLCSPNYIVQGTAAWTETNLHPLMLSYISEMAGLVNRTTIFPGSLRIFELISNAWQNGTSVLADFVHPTDAGYALKGQANAQAAMSGISQILGFDGLSIGMGSGGTNSYLTVRRYLPQMLKRRRGQAR